MNFTLGKLKRKPCGFVDVWFPIFAVFAIFKKNKDRDFLLSYDVWFPIFAKRGKTITTIKSCWLSKGNLEILHNVASNVAKNTFFPQEITRGKKAPFPLFFFSDSIFLDFPFFFLSSTSAKHPPTKLRIWQGDQRSFTNGLKAFTFTVHLFESSKMGVGRKKL